MATGVGIGFVFPNITEWNEAVSVGATNIPLAIGLILMMYPPLAKVNYSLLGKIVSDKKAIGLSLFMNWIIDPILTVCSGISFFGQLSGVISPLVEMLVLIMLVNIALRLKNKYKLVG
jgi:ACR3 family arsenite transporter